MRVVLLTLFCLIAVAALSYKAVVDTYEEVQLDVYDSVIGRLATHSVTDITVHVDVRDVTLIGQVQDAQGRAHIIQLVKDLAVVRNVINRIEVEHSKDAPSKQTG